MLSHVLQNVRKRFVHLSQSTWKLFAQLVREFLQNSHTGERVSSVVHACHGKVCHIHLQQVVHDVSHQLLQRILLHPSSFTLRRLLVSHGQIKGIIQNHSFRLCFLWTKNRFSQLARHRSTHSKASWRCSVEIGASSNSFQRFASNTQQNNLCTTSVARETHIPFFQTLANDKCDIVETMHRQAALTVDPSKALQIVSRAFKHP